MRRNPYDQRERARRQWTRYVQRRRMDDLDQRIKRVLPWYPSTSADFVRAFNAAVRDAAAAIAPALQAFADAMQALQVQRTTMASAPPSEHKGEAVED